jgi:hypothetical protein
MTSPSTGDPICATQLTSPNQVYIVLMSGGGLLKIDGTKVLWSESWFAQEGSGYAICLFSNGTFAEMSGVTGSLHVIAALSLAYLPPSVVLDNFGTLSIQDRQGTTWWSSWFMTLFSAYPAEQCLSAAGQGTNIHLGDQALGTNYLELNANGSLAFYTTGNQLAWNTTTFANATSLCLQSSGYLNIVNSTGGVLWSSQQDGQGTPSGGPYTLQVLSGTWHSGSTGYQAQILNSAMTVLWYRP